MKKSFLHILLIMVIVLALSVSTVVNVIANEQPDEQGSQEPSNGQENIVLRARQVYEIEWTPLKNVIKWGRYGIFRAGEPVQGLPYGMPGEANYVPLRTSFAEFLEAVEDERSRLYRSIATRTNAAPYYSLDCSGFITWVWGLERRLMTGGLPIVSKNMGRDLKNIQIGDALNSPGFHVVLVTDITYDNEGEISAIGIMELDVPQAQYTLYGEDGTRPLNDIRRRYLHNGFSILRYNNRDDVVYMHDCTVPIDGDHCDKCSGDDLDEKLPHFIMQQNDARHLYAIEFIDKYGAPNGISLNAETYDYTTTRGMFFVMLSRYANADTEKYEESVFEDVPIEEWYGKAIAWAVDIGIVDAEGDRFHPRELISNEEMAHVMFNYIFWLNNQSSTDTPFIYLNIFT